MTKTGEQMQKLQWLEYRRSTEMTDGPKVPSPHVATGEELDAWADSFGVPPRGSLSRQIAAEGEPGYVDALTGNRMETDDSLRKRVLAKLTPPTELRAREITLQEADAIMGTEDVRL